MNLDGLIILVDLIFLVPLFVVTLLAAIILESRKSRHGLPCYKNEKNTSTHHVYQFCDSWSFHTFFVFKLGGSLLMKQ